MGSGEKTRERLLDAAIQTLAEEGIAGTSARAIGRRGEVNQALIFYHFESVEGLLAEASREVSRRRATVYAERMSAVTSLAELAQLARQLHAEERESGNLAVLTQLLAGARTHPALAPALEENFALLAGVVEATLSRLLDGSVLAAIVPARQLAQTISAGFLGLELLDTLGHDDDPDMFATLEALSRLGDALLQAGAIESTILRRRISSVQQGERA